MNQVLAKQLPNWMHASPWLRTIVMATLIVGVLGMLAALMMFARALAGGPVRGPQVVFLTLLGLSCLWSGFATLERSEIGRNFAVVMVTVVAWMIGDLVGTRWELGALAKFPAIAYAAACLVYFFGAEGRAWFAAGDENAQ